MLVMEKNHYRNNYLLYTILCIVALITMAFTGGAILFNTNLNGDSNYNRVRGVTNYTHTINESNTGISGTTLTTVINSSYPIYFTVSSGTTISNGVITIPANGFIYNDSAINGITSITATYNNNFYYGYSTVSSSDTNFTNMSSQASTGSGSNITKSFTNGANYFYLKNASGSASKTITNLTITYSCSYVNPSNPSSVTLKVDDSSSDQTIYMGSGAHNLTTAFTCANESYKDVTYVLNTSSYLTLTSTSHNTATITPKANGTTTITAKWHNSSNVSYQDTIVVTVKTYVTGISLSVSSFILDINEDNNAGTPHQQAITATVSPNTANEGGNVEWSISPTGYAQFSNGSTTATTALSGTTATVYVDPIQTTSSTITITASFTSLSGSTYNTTASLTSIVRGENGSLSGTWPSTTNSNPYTNIDGTLTAPGTVYQNFSDGTTGNFYKSISTSTTYSLLTSASNDTIGGNALKIENLTGGDDNIVKMTCNAIPREVPITISVSFQYKWLGPTTNIDRDYFGVRYDGGSDLYNIRLNSGGRTSTGVTYNLEYEYTLSIPGRYETNGKSYIGPSFYLCFLGQSDSHTSSPFVVDNFVISYSYASVDSTTKDEEYGLPCTNRGNGTNTNFIALNNVAVSDWAISSSTDSSYAYKLERNVTTAFDVTFINTTGYVTKGHSYQVRVAYYIDEGNRTSNVYLVINITGSDDILFLNEVSPETGGSKSGIYETSSSYTAASNAMNIRFHSPSGFSGNIYIQRIELIVVS